MTNKSPIFPIHEPHHFSDYGFDPQIDYFQVLEEARNHKLQHPSSSSRSAVDNVHFKLQKPNSKDESSKKIKKSRKRWWWKNALLFFKRKRAPSAAAADGDYAPSYVYGSGGVRALSGPVYLAESRSGASTPYHRSSASRPSSGPLAGTFNIPYISLTELNIDPTRKISGSPMPIYLVT